MAERSALRHGNYAAAVCVLVFFFFQAEDGIRDLTVTGVQTCALPISPTAMCAGCTPDRLTDAGSKAAIAAAPCGGRVSRTRLYRMPNPVIRIIVASRAHNVDGWVRSLVHSDRSTRAWVTRCCNW